MRSGFARHIPRVDQVAKRCEQGLRRLRPWKPSPALAFVRLSNFGVARRAVRHDKQSHVVLSLVLEDVVGVGAEAHRLNDKPSLLGHLSDGTALNALTELEVAPRQCPSARAVRSAALAKKHPAAAKNDDGNPNSRWQIGRW